MRSKRTVFDVAASANTDGCGADGGAEPVESGARVVAGMPSLVCAADLTMERIDWLWRGRLARGCISVLDGDPGLGKSTVVADIAAHLSRGDPLEGDDLRREPESVLLVSYEDHPAAVILPRLVAAGASLERVHVWPLANLPSLPHGLAAIEGAIESINASLVVFDPLMAALAGDVNAHRDQDVRRVLAAVNAVAERTRAAFLFVRHLNKESRTSRALYRGGGSIGIIGAARCGMILDVDLDDSGARVLAVTKCNLGVKAPSLRLRIVPAPSPAKGIEVGRVQWDGTSAANADELVEAPDDREARCAIDDALETLRAILADGPVPATQAMDDAKAAGHSERTIKRAKEKLHVVSERDGLRGPWSWRLAKSARPATE